MCFCSAAGQRRLPSGWMKKRWAIAQYAEYGAVAVVETRHNMALVVQKQRAVEPELNAQRIHKHNVSIDIIWTDD